MADYNSAYTGAQIDEAVQRGLVRQYGWQNFQDTATALSPIALSSSDTWYDLTNNAAGTLTTTDYKVEGHGTIWDSATNTFDFSSLSVGDMVRIRFDILASSSGTNRIFTTRLAFGTGYTFANVLDRAYFKNSTTDGQIFRYFAFAMLTADTVNNPAKLQISCDSSGSTVKVNGWLVETEVFVP